MTDLETMPCLKLAATSSSSQLLPFGMQAECCQSLQFVGFFFKRRLHFYVNFPILKNLERPKKEVCGLGLAQRPSFPCHIEDGGLQLF